RTRAVLLAETGRTADARAELERFVADYPDEGVAIGFLGNVELSQGRAARALELFDRSLELRGPTSDVLFNRGHALRALGREADALDDWRRALGLDPKLSLARLELIEAAESAGHWSEALALARDGARANPDDAWLACRWALLLATVPDGSLRD